MLVVDVSVDEGSRKTEAVYMQYILQGITKIVGSQNKSASFQE